MQNLHDRKVFPADLRRKKAQIFTDWYAGICADLRGHLRYLREIKIGCREHAIPIAMVIIVRELGYEKYSRFYFAKNIISVGKKLQKLA
jgi:hypothetical protein